MDNNITYSTAITPEIEDAYNNWQSLTNKPSAYSVESNQAFLLFVELCEKNNKYVYSVIESLNK